MTADAKHMIAISLGELLAQGITRDDVIEFLGGSGVDGYMTVEEAGMHLRSTRRAIYKWAAAGKLQLHEAGARPCSSGPKSRPLFDLLCECQEWLAAPI